MVLLLALPRGDRFDFAKQGAAGDASVRSGASTTQTYDITVSPGTPATTVQLYYTLEEMISLFDLTTPVRTVNLVYTCTCNVYIRLSVYQFIHYFAPYI